MGRADFACRAWLSIVMLQSVGHIFMSYYGKATTDLYAYTATGALPRSSALSHIILVCIRLCLLIDFSSHGLHMCNIISSLLQALHMASEMFFYKSLTFAFTNYFGIGVNVITALLFVVLFSSHTAPPPEPVKENRRSGRLFAKHYFEADVITTPDTPEIRELRKRTN